MLAESDYFEEIIQFQKLQFIVTRITSVIGICITLLFLLRKQFIMALICIPVLCKNEILNCYSEPNMQTIMSINTPLTLEILNTLVSE